MLACQKILGGDILILDKVDFKAKNTTWINTYAPDKKAPKRIKQTERTARRNRSTIIVREFNTSLNYREPFQAWEMWPSPHSEKPVGSEFH